MTKKLLEFPGLQPTDHKDSNLDVNRARYRNIADLRAAVGSYELRSYIVPEL